jgi:hypothetical protein
MDIESDKRADLAELRLLGRAVKSGWRIPLATRKLAVEKLTSILATATSRKAQVAVCRVLAVMSSVEVSAIIAELRVRQSRGAETGLAVNVNLGANGTDAPVIEKLSGAEFRNLWWEAVDDACKDNMNEGPNP